MADVNWQRLADEVIRRRGHMGYSTRQEFADATGFAQKTLGDIEKCRRTNFDRVTLARLEKALGWPEGHVQELLNTPPDLPIVYEYASGPVDASAELMTPQGLLAHMFANRMDLVERLNRPEFDVDTRWRWVQRIRAATAELDEALMAEIDAAGEEHGA